MAQAPNFILDVSGDVTLYTPRGGERRTVLQLPQSSVAAGSTPDHLALQLSWKAPQEPGFQTVFKERSYYLFVAWGATVTSLNYLHSNPREREYPEVMTAAAALVATSFLGWLVLCFFHSGACSDPCENMVCNLVRSVCYAAAVLGLCITFLVIYFSGNLTVPVAMILSVFVLIVMIIFHTLTRLTIAWIVFRTRLAGAWTAFRTRLAGAWTSFHTRLAGAWTAFRTWLAGPVDVNAPLLVR